LFVCLFVFLFVCLFVCCIPAPISIANRLVETSLTSVLPKDGMNRWKWNSKSDDLEIDEPATKDSTLSASLVTIQPGEIKTFLLTL
jgi:hypothetical protein